MRLSLGRLGFGKVAIAAVAVAIGMSATATSQRVENFELIDHRGDAHELYYYSDASAVVLMVQGNGCPIVRNALPDFRKVRDTYDDKGVVFLMLNSNLQDHRASIADEAEEWSIDFPILEDDTQLVGEGLGLTRTAEVLVIDPKNWGLAYRGPINDRLSYERQKETADEHYLASALDAVIAGNDVAIETKGAQGCLINFAESEKDHAAISYTETIAPMLQDKCVRCHTPGGIGPWAMTSYEMVRGFAPMMREVVRTKRMPPWHADPHVGNWQDDRSLSVEQKQTLVHWIEAGAPRGDGPDPLAAAATPAPDWPLGEPDLILELPPADIPASGIVDYSYPVLANTIGKDVWVKAMTVLPGDASVVHHVLAGTSAPGAKPDERQEGVFYNYLGGYAPGSGSSIMPEGTGVFVAQDTLFLLQMHYTPAGKAVTDQTRVALYFHEETPSNFLRHGVVLNPAIRIPPNAKSHEERAYFSFDKDALLYTVLPHSHYRGRSSTFTLIDPAGNEELLLSVPNYDFNWQRGYDFVEPKHIPAGSKLVHVTVYDNSSQNPANPDPDRAVPWGLQSHDEMLYGDFVFSWVDETAAQPIHENDRMQATQFIGFLDKNMDGLVHWEELGERMQQRMQGAFKNGDRNGDRALSVEEYLGIQRAQKARRQREVAASER